jgi:uncharacterized iron-regulated membrane protein
LKKRPKKKDRSRFYKISAWLHLWLGLATGIVVVIVSITGAILTFEEELRLAFQPYQTVQDEGKAFLPPSELATAVKAAYHIDGVSAVIYRGRERSAVIPWYGDRKNFVVNYVNPYTGKALYSQRLDDDFYRIMIVGHYQLWLPRNIGKPVVAYSTLIFVLTLFSGLILWWPRRWTKATKKQSFLIRTRASLKRLNYDLHNVLGFYALIVALILGLTGMVYGMQWFSKAVYWSASGGETAKNKPVLSDSTLFSTGKLPDEDVLFRKLQTAKTDMKSQNITFGYPFGKTGVWNVAINPKPMTRYLERSRYYEQHSTRLLKTEANFKDVNGGDQVMKLNYDLHVGAIGGITTKILAFLACLISASLPITGLIIWLAKKRKKAKPVAKAAELGHVIP